MHHSKAEEKAKLRNGWEGKFLFRQQHYDLMPPPPFDGPTIIKPAVDVEALTAHRLYSSQIATLTPLLVPAHLGLPPEHFLLLQHHFTKQQDLAPEDADLLSEKLMWAKNG